MNNEKDHFLAKRIQEFQRQNAKGFVCHLCEDGPYFSSETKLFDHARAQHQDAAGSSKHDEAWKAFVADASSRAKQRSASRLATNQAVSSKSQTGENTKAHSSLSRPASTPGPTRSTNKKIEDLMELSLDSRPEPIPVDIQGDSELGLPQTNPLKRAAVGESGLSDHVTQQGETQGTSRSRRVKAVSGGSFVPRDPDFERKLSTTRDQNVSNERAGPQKRLFDPNSDRTTLAPNIRKAGKIEGPIPSRRIYDARSHLFRSPKDGPDDRDHPGGPSRPTQPLETDKPRINSGRSIGYSFHQEMPDHGESDTYLESEPELLLQPETRPISHEQLVIEVKGIYAGLVMVESKCIDVDDKQTMAALEKDPLKQTRLTPEQWQALIALHKTLLHEHHDFFLASQHPSASPALSRLAAKYSMPGRMWRHGIHAFLEVLRHRLPDSLDHMLAFIYIAYSMMALLYETVPTFEDTWIECLGDLGRYRMAIEDDDIRDREVWSAVARLWYRKAADKNPKVGRLYHHLAILARPYTLQQLSLYTRSLTCVEPFESAKASIMTLFKPILDGKEYAHHRSSSMETVFIKAHGLLYTQGPVPAFQDCVQQLLGGLIDSYVDRVTAKFKEQGVFAALSNIASLFEYGLSNNKGGSRSLLRLEFEATLPDKSQGLHQSTEKIDHVSSARVATPAETTMTAQEKERSLQMIANACKLSFGTLSIALRRVGDKNVEPLVHVYLVFLSSLVSIPEAAKLLERFVPWREIAFFLNSLAGAGGKTSREMGKEFPRPKEGGGRPLPEDFLMRGQLWSEFYFPLTWFSEASVDDEERSLELPSMSAPRTERLRWLGHGIAARGRWLSHEHASGTFIVTQYVLDLPPPEITHEMLSVAPFKDQDSIMSGMDDDDEGALSHIPDSPPRERETSFDSNRSDSHLPTVSDEYKASKPNASPKKSQEFMPRKILSKADTEMTESRGPESELSNINPDSEEWLNRRSHSETPFPRKDDYPPGYHKYDTVKVLEENMESNK